MGNGNFKHVFLGTMILHLQTFKKNAAVLWMTLAITIYKLNVLFDEGWYLICVYLDSDGLEVFWDVYENGDDKDGNGELDPPPAHRLRRDGRAVLVRVADGHVPLVGDGDDDKNWDEKPSFKFVSLPTYYLRFLIFTYELERFKQTILAIKNKASIS